MILRRNITRCYDCYPRAQAKTFQVCTLRTLPEKPIHCLVWGKHLFNLMFGPPSDQNLLSDVLDNLNKEELSKSENPRADLFDRTNQVFLKVFHHMLQEQKNSNPEKFAYVKTISQDEISNLISFQSLSKTIDLTADPDKIMPPDFYIQNFYSSQTLSSGCSRTFRISFGTRRHPFF